MKASIVTIFLLATLRLTCTKDAPPIQDDVVDEEDQEMDDLELDEGLVRRDGCDVSANHADGDGVRDRACGLLVRVLDRSLRAGARKGCCPSRRATGRAAMVVVR